MKAMNSVGKRSRFTEISIEGSTLNFLTLKTVRFWLPFIFSLWMDLQNIIFVLFNYSVKKFLFCPLLEGKGSTLLRKFP